MYPDKKMNRRWSWPGEKNTMKTLIAMIDTRKAPPGCPRAAHQHTSHAREGDASRTQDSKARAGPTPEGRPADRGRGKTPLGQAGGRKESRLKIAVAGIIPRKGETVANRERMHQMKRRRLPFTDPDWLEARFPELVRPLWPPDCPR